MRAHTHPLCDGCNALHDTLDEIREALDCDAEHGPVDQIDDLIVSHCKLVAERDSLRDQLAAAHQAVGLLTTLAPSVVMDPDDLLGMAQKIVESVQRIPDDAALDALVASLSALSPDIFSDRMNSAARAITALRRQLAEARQFIQGREEEMDCTVSTRAAMRGDRDAE